MLGLVSRNFGTIFTFISRNFAKYGQKNFAKYEINFWCEISRNFVSRNFVSTLGASIHFLRRSRVGGVRLKKKGGGLGFDTWFTPKLGNNSSLWSLHYAYMWSIHIQSFIYLFVLFLLGYDLHCPHDFPMWRPWEHISAGALRKRHHLCHHGLCRSA
jgi:hypothetical protein